MIEATLQDAKFAARRLGRSPGFSATVILTLALGIGATTAIFSVVYGVLLRPLPYPEPGRLAAIWEVNHRGTYSRLADPNFDDFREQNRTFEAMAKYTTYTATVAGPGEPARSVVSLVSEQFLHVLRVAPSLGRGFAHDDARQGAAPVALVSDRYWKEHLASARDLSRLTLRVQDRAYSVAGVLPAGFDYPAKTEVWLPAELDPINPSRTSHNFYGVGRLRPGVSPVEASADLDTIARRIVGQSSERSDYLLRGAAAVTLQSSQTATVRSPLLILLGAVGVLLLVACANVANFLLAEASTRTRELAVRHALGAGRGRLVRQFVVEMLLLSCVSGVVGVLLAVVLLRALLALAPASLPRLSEIAVSWPVAGFAAGLSFLVALGLGVLTAVRASSGRPGTGLGDAGRGHAGSARGRRVGRMIVAAQLAMTLALLTGAGLLGRSLLQVLSVDPGFRTDHVVVADLELPEPGEMKPDEAQAFRARTSQFVGRLVNRLHAIPGVQHAAAVNAVPMDGGLPDGMFLLVNWQENPRNFDEYTALARQEARRGSADFCAATPGYFQALGIPLVRGRLFDDRDGLDAPHAALVTESLARLRWPHQDPIGQTIQFGNMDGDLHLLTVVGIVGDTHEYGLEDPPRPTVYVNLLQRPRTGFSLVLHAEGDAGAVTAAARAILRDDARDVAPRFRTFSQIYSASMGSRRFNLTLVAVFALTALVLAVAGVYGVVAYGVAQRTQEIGVRMALGARAADVSSLVLGQGLKTTLAGVAFGVVASFAAARAIRSLLFGVEPTDLTTFVGVAVGLTAVAALACYLPARRAARVDPTVALRGE
jgi:putative ABC transport system permease protein